MTTRLRWRRARDTTAHTSTGNIARVFAREHPDEVTGMVLVDILSPELRAHMTPNEWDNGPVVIRSIRQVVDAVRAGKTSLAGE